MVSPQGKCHHTNTSKLWMQWGVERSYFNLMGRCVTELQLFWRYCWAFALSPYEHRKFWTLCVKLSNTSFGLLELIHIANAIFWPIIRMFVTIIWGYFDDPSLFISCQSTSKKIIQHMTLTVIRTYCTHCSCNQKLLVMLPLINFSEQFSSNF